MPQATETLDARGMHVLPGAIDVHVHFRDPAIRTRRISPAHGGGGFRRRYHNIRHAKHHSADRHA